MKLKDAQEIGLDFLTLWWKAYDAGDFKKCRKIARSIKGLSALVDTPTQVSPVSAMGAGGHRRE